MRIVEWFPPLFADRGASGRALADALAEVAPAEVVVVGVARGGVAVAAEVARARGAPLTAVDVERVLVGGQRVGAVTADGLPYLRPGHGAGADELDAALARARRAAATLDARLEVPPASLEGHAALVVDDGLVTGMTLAAGCRWARGRDAASVVAAIPVGRTDGLAELATEADAVVCPHPLEELTVVGQAYDSFDPLDEWYVSTLLRR